MHMVATVWLNLWECINYQSSLIAIIAGYIYIARPLWVSSAVHAVLRQQVLSALRSDPLIQHAGRCKCEQVLKQVRHLIKELREKEQKLDKHFKGLRPAEYSNQVDKWFSLNYGYPVKQESTDESRPIIYHVRKVSGGRKSFESISVFERVFTSCHKVK